MRVTLGFLDFEHQNLVNLRPRINYARRQDIVLLQYVM